MNNRKSLQKLENKYSKNCKLEIKYGLNNF